MKTKPPHISSISDEELQEFVGSRQNKGGRQDSSNIETNDLLASRTGWV